jgi:PII-like signaling protein
MHGIAGERTLMRIHVDETDRWKGSLLYDVILRTLREHGLAGVTIIRSIMSFGSRRILHSDFNEITSLDRPVVIECVDAEERIAAILPLIDRMITSGLITFERAEVIVYRAPSGSSGVES